MVQSQIYKCQFLLSLFVELLVLLINLNHVIFRITTEQRCVTLLVGGKRTDEEESNYYYYCVRQNAVLIA